MQASAVRAFSILASKIHPQLPLTPRESQQLLSLLTSSFRRHLDREHPRIATDDASAPSCRPLKSPKQRAIPGSALSSTSSQVPTSKLLESILANPLLAHKPSGHLTRPPVPNLPGTADSYSQWFKDRIADGSATLDMALLYAEGMKESGNMAENGASSSRGAGSEIVQWLWASGLETTTRFVGKQALHASLASLLIHERNERPLWRWLGSNYRRELEEAGVPSKDIFRFRGQLLKAVVLCKLSAQGGLEDAISAHIHACSTGQSTFRYLEYFTSGTLIVKHISANPSGPSISSSLYDAFIHSTRQWCRQPEGFKAMLYLNHPSIPTLDPALQYLKSIAEDHKVPKHAQMRRFQVQLSLSLARGLLAEERFSEGLWVLDFLKEKYPQEVGWKAAPTNSKEEEHSSSISKDELENLQLLEALDV